MPPAKQLGSAGERRAAAYIAGLGMRVVERNYRCRQGEIDLIAWDADTLVFVEVKARRSGACGAPEEAVSALKQRRIRRVALYYLTQLGYEPFCRFDVISVHGDQVTHFQAAFE